ncbi:MBL fold metallo-hydrolase [Actinomadura sp. BRA 177]|uniref:MBL fold metallo-hydrolase n=1 Tax=Actinomadura sp. BRA 177 TaxID=2745202 RepID=UPI0015953E5E|nr:MBL fold metallo-hydrolase [Actinomadura sp. BRA 177]NVI87588.1 MBL fold metallo-hydrolase [Actinomadura sp. BRA 177]
MTVTEPAISSDALGPVLRAVALAVLERQSAARLPSDPDALVRGHTPLLLEAAERFPALRAQAAARLTDAGDEARALAAVLLHPDDGVVRTALAWIGRRERAAERAARDADRTARRISHLRKRVKTEQGRLEYARRDAQEASQQLTATQEALAEQEERADTLTRRLATEHHRWTDPRALAAALLTTLERPSADPRATTENTPAARHAAPQAAAPGGTLGDAPAVRRAAPQAAVPGASEGDEAAAVRRAAPPAAAFGVLRGGVVGESAVAGESTHLAAAARAVGKGPEEVLGVLRALVDPAPPPVVVTTELNLRVVPLGGDTHIGGSCVLVEAGGTRILVDAGLRPGDRAEPPRDIGRALDGSLDAVVVTHAHNDHCGYVPAMVARRPGVRVLASPETAALMPVMWADTAKVLAARERGRARWGDSGDVLYGAADVEAASRRREELPFGVPRRIGALTVELFPAGHILGAAGVVVRAGDRRVVITGDISGFRQETVGGYVVPESARAADLLVLESTCCTEEHDDRDLRVDELVRAVADVTGSGGRVLIPAFALGRAQEIAMIMRRHLPEVPVRLDGMAAELATVFESLDPALRVFGGATAVANRPAELDAFRTGVVISTSGMLTGGPAVRWASRILPEPGSALFISGYQDEESPGRALRDLAEKGGEFPLLDHGREITVPVRARVDRIRLSAHADRRGLLGIADEVAAREVMLVHGIPGRQRTFAETLRVHGRRPVATGPWNLGGDGWPKGFL